MPQAMYKREKKVHLTTSAVKIGYKHLWNSKLNFWMLKQPHPAPLHPHSSSAYPPKKESGFPSIRKQEWKSQWERRKLNRVAQNSGFGFLILSSFRLKLQVSIRRQYPSGGEDFGYMSFRSVTPSVNVFLSVTGQALNEIEIPFVHPQT
ncbi:hypothetical protein VNO77_46344 [Canavalia gladiata]|uniref:Uncharacterized protein n=1 Tax=Canavalia gladiata TaxID=3824 RepID=A0AAN9JIM8_CANGL